MYTKKIKINTVKLKKLKLYYGFKTIKRNAVLDA